MSSSVWCCCVASKDRVLLGKGAHPGSGCAIPGLHSTGAAGLENPMRPKNEGHQQAHLAGLVGTVWAGSRQSSETVLIVPARSFGGDSRISGDTLVTIGQVAHSLLR